jgi:hypothetical protein
MAGSQAKVSRHMMVVDMRLEVGSLGWYPVWFSWPAGDARLVVAVWTQLLSGGITRMPSCGSANSVLIHLRP